MKCTRHLCHAEPMRPAAIGCLNRAWANENTYGYVMPASERSRNAPTSSSRSLQIQRGRVVHSHRGQRLIRTRQDITSWDGIQAWAPTVYCESWPH